MCVSSHWDNVYDMKYKLTEILWMFIIYYEWCKLVNCGCLGIIYHRLRLRLGRTVGKCWSLYFLILIISAHSSTVDCTLVYSCCTDYNGNIRYSIQYSMRLILPQYYVEISCLCLFIPFVPFFFLILLSKDGMKSHNSPKLRTKVRIFTPHYGLKGELSHTRWTVLEGNSI